ncbi:MAG: hypothetical protein IKN71_08635 [Alphaproteobacteria bacterium]|nr:hypothetical protein [Alphaproteobacteria bacterium]
MTETNNIFLALYPDGHNEKIMLGELLNKGGAAGKIYIDASHPNSVAKIFHEKEHSNTNRQKLEAMLHNRPNITTFFNDKDGKEYTQIAWPTALLEDSQGFCVGYLMPRIDTTETVLLDHLIQKAVRKKLGLTERYLARVVAAYNIATIVAKLHACGHYIVDLKPSNIYVYKKNQVAIAFDCDGFSIKGENGARYPAEFVSEEYIYPEGMNLTCKEMGEEQDKFALAVIIFKLLNEGIHPFSGTPRNNGDMLSIQERITEYHYAYGFWPDSYQQPNPYSIHDYLDKETMNLFERAFTKGNERPTALEWQTHLAYLLDHCKPCKKDKNHVYFTPKGCGLCIVSEKFKEQVNNYKKQKEEPQTVRGLSIKKLTTENLKRKKQEQEQLKHLQNYGLKAFFVIYLLFFTFLYKIAGFFRQSLIDMGIFAQLILITLFIIGINRLLAALAGQMSDKKQHNFLSMLQIYAYICLLIAFLVVNGLPMQWLNLAP